MINPGQLRQYVIEPALEHLTPYDERLASESAIKLLLGTIAHESLGGHYLRQIGGPALGIYQIEPATHDDLWETFLAFRPELMALVKEAGSDSERLVYDLRYATMIARLVYWRSPEPLPAPDDRLGIAKYWKSVYNSDQGRGTVQGFLENYAMMEKA